MDGKSFEDWFAKVLPQLEDNCVIVLDNAPYHTRRVEKIPTTASAKSEIKEWLQSKNINFDENLLKVELLAIVKQNKEKYTRYIIDEMAKSQNKTVLRLPPYHCELNPIELIWADIKNFVAKHNTTFKFSDAKNLFHDAVKTITPEKWKNCVKHVTNTIEVRMWELDNIIERNIEPIIINLQEDSQSNSSDSE